MDKRKLTVYDSLSHPLSRNRNRNPSSSAIVSGDVKFLQDVKDQQVSSHLNLHPLQIDNVVRKVLTFLDTQSLKNCRLVCKLWNLEGGKVLLKTAFIRPYPRPRSRPELGNSKWNFINGKKRREMEVENLVNFLNLTWGQNLNFVVHSSDLLSVLNSFPPSLLSRVHQLRYERDDSLFAVTNLIEMLAHQKLPNMKILETRALEPKFWTLIFPFFHRDPFPFFHLFFLSREQYFQNLVDKLMMNQNTITDSSNIGGKKILKLRSTFSPLEKIYLFKNYRMKLSGFSKISINIGHRQRRACQILFTPSKLKWPLTHAHLKLEGLGDSNSNSSPNPDPFFHNFHRSFSRSEVISWVDVEKSRNFFKTNSTSLRHLVVDVGNFTQKIKIESQNGPWTDNWLVPLDLPHLHTMIILGNNFDFIFSLLTIALRSKHLKRISLQRVPYFLENDIRKWEEDRNQKSQGRKLRSDSIREVEIHGLIPASSSLVLSGILWPSVKQLRIGLDYFDLNIWTLKRTSPLSNFDQNPELNIENVEAENIFENWTRLEKLELDFQSILEKNMTKDLELYGNWIEGKFDSDQKKFQLENLKNLTSLTLRGHSEIKCGIFVDSLIYNCLGFMTNLQSLRIYGQNSFSEKALDDLRIFLGIGVSILIECPQKTQVQKGARNFVQSIFSGVIK